MGGAYGPPPMPGAPPPPPARPPAVGPPPEPDAARAVGAGLLNLSGLGLGYVLLKQWVWAAVCVAATVALLVYALPADVDGVSGWVVVGYVVLLVLAALDGARRGLRTRKALPVRSYVAVGLGLVLLAVPAGGAVFYRGAQDEAVQKMLLARLAGTDAVVERAKGAAGFAAAEQDYRAALVQYRQLVREHGDSRAAKQVPQRLDAYYKAVGAPFAQGKYCEAVKPLTYLRTVPEAVGKDTAGALATWPDGRLATSLYECGMTGLGTTAGGAGGGELSDLLRTFPGSEQAGKVEPGVRARIAERRQALSGGDPCPVTEQLRRISTTASGLPGVTGTTLRGEADGAVEGGVWSCGLDQYRDKDFASARSTLASFASTYKGSPNAQRARTIAIAAEIAVSRPAAGAGLPSASAPGGARMSYVISNDSPTPTVILYTGPITGSFTMPGCSGCTSYRTEAAARGTACKDTGKNYPKHRLALPAGKYYFLSKPSGSSVRPGQGNSEGSVRPGYTYTQCTYNVNPFGIDLPQPPGTRTEYRP
ncbi:hypothetical protein [Streptomyces sp. NPDC051561]|uniref:hypothetical protein n=1 Tax=Streptomyces sp. NPDC051561 TaxID=3365658 RepID=UPI00379E42B8